jgi:hypothetical protein
MSGVQQVLNDCLSLDDGKMRVAKFHVVRSLSHDDGHTPHRRLRYSPSLTAHRAASPEGWSQIWLHAFANRALCAQSSAYGVLEGMPWRRGRMRMPCETTDRS